MIGLLAREVERMPARIDGRVDCSASGRLRPIKNLISRWLEGFELTSEDTVHLSRHMLPKLLLRP